MILKSVHLYVLPMFFIPANIPAPRPIVPKEPKAKDNFVTPCTNPFNKLTPSFKVSDFTMVLTNSVHELDNALSLPYFVQQRSLIFASYSL